MTTEMRPTASLRVRRAHLGDRDLLVTAISTAERGGLEVSIYEQAFELSPDELRAMLASSLEEALDADLPAGELNPASFWVVEDAGEPIAVRASWIEGEGLTSSSHGKGMLLAHVLGSRVWAKGLPRLRAIGGVDLPRTPGAAQFECSYITPSHRGRGIMMRLDATIIRHWSGLKAPAALGQALTIFGNDDAVRLFERLGFRCVKTVARENLDLEVASLVPWRGRQLWERSLHGPLPAEPFPDPTSA